MYSKNLMRVLMQHNKRKHITQVPIYRNFSPIHRIDFFRNRIRAEIDSVYQKQNTSDRIRAKIDSVYQGNDARFFVRSNRSRGV